MTGVQTCALPICEITDAEKPAFLSGAMALLVPIDWPEPFGLVMIEAMACGTPVLAYRAGSVSEVIEHGVTGLIVDNIDQARIALVQAISMDRRKIRRRFEERFTARRMANDYLRVYRNLVRHAARPARDAAHGVNGGARIGTERIVDVSEHAD